MEDEEGMAREKCARCCCCCFYGQVVVVMSSRKARSRGRGDVVV